MWACLSTCALLWGFGLDMRSDVRIEMCTELCMDGSWRSRCRIIDLDCEGRLHGASRARVQTVEGRSSGRAYTLHGRSSGRAYTVHESKQSTAARAQTVHQCTGTNSTGKGAAARAQRCTSTAVQRRKRNSVRTRARARTAESGGAPLLRR